MHLRSTIAVAQAALEIPSNALEAAAQERKSMSDSYMTILYSSQSGAEATRSSNGLFTWKNPLETAEATVFWRILADDC